LQPETAVSGLDLIKAKHKYRTYPAWPLRPRRVNQTNAGPGKMTEGFAIRAAGVIDASAGSAVSLSQGPIPTLFYPLLNKCLALPLLASWSEYLWENGRTRNLITLLDKGKGQGYAAWRVLPATKEWQGVVQEGLACATISF
jgi:hypothetical protein